MNTENNPTCDLKCVINESETIDTLKKKLSFLDNKKNDLYREVNTVYGEMSKIRKDIYNRYMTDFLNSKKVITETYFKYYSSVCKILELKNIFDDTVSVDVLIIRKENEISIVELNFSFDEIFDNIITKSEFEEKFKSTVNTLFSKANLGQTTIGTEIPNDEIWIQSSTNNFTINGEDNGD